MGNLHISYVLEDGLFKKKFGYCPQKFKLKILNTENFAYPKTGSLGNCLSKRQARRVLAKSLLQVQKPRLLNRGYYSKEG